jgi:hypothetical protein
MSVHPTTIKFTRGLAVAGSTLATLAVPSAAMAGTTVIEGNPTCADAGAGATLIKIDPVRQGTTTFDTGSFKGAIDVDDVTFDWTTATPVSVVIVKGGTAATVYQVSPTTSGSDWHAPINPNTGRPYGLSHITFCAGGTPPATEEPPPSGGGGGGGTTPPDTTPPATTPPATTPPATTPPETTPPASTPPAVTVTPTQEVKDETSSGGPKKPAKPVAATARVQGPSRCVTGAARVTIRGKGIRKVVFRVNGRKVAVVRGRRSAYSTRVKADRAVQRVTARVTFVAASRTRARTLRTTVLACQSQTPAVQPHFTG